MYVLVSSLLSVAFQVSAYRLREWRKFNNSDWEDRDYSGESNPRNPAAPMGSVQRDLAVSMVGIDEMPHCGHTSTIYGLTQSK